MFVFEYVGRSGFVMVEKCALVHFSFDTKDIE